MNENQEEEPIQQCLKLIESQLAWGDSADWSHYDFEKLSEAIQRQTNVRLSVTTLKRQWGRLSYTSIPTLATLNTLAQYAGYADWRSFKLRRPPAGQRNALLEAEPDKRNRIGSALTQPIAASAQALGRRERSWFKLAWSPRVWYGIAFLLVLTLGVWMAHNPIQPLYELNPADFSFTADKVVTKGVPNSVVFHYDARAGRTDSVYIVQTWDSRRKTRVSKDYRAHSALYYYPGFFRTKLLVDGQVVKMHDLCINTDGWLGLVEQKPIPLYFKKSDYWRSNRVEIDASTLKAYRLSLYPQAPAIRFFNQQPMDGFMSDNFVFETWLKTNFRSGAGACQYVEVLIQCQDDIIILPLAAKPCVGGLHLVFCGDDISSKVADLSGFGCDLTHWTRLRVETVNKRATIYVNDSQAYQLVFPNRPTGLVGLQYRFTGVGAVKDTWFEYKGRRIRF